MTTIVANKNGTGAMLAANQEPKLLTVEVAPKDFFDPVPGAVQQVATVGNFTVATFKDASVVQNAIFDHAGKRVHELPLKLAGSITASDVLRSVEKLDGKFVKLLPTAGYSWDYRDSEDNYVTSNQIATDLGLSQSRAVELDTALRNLKCIEEVSHRGKTWSGVSAESLKKLGGQVLMSTEPKLTSDDNDRAVVLENKGRLTFLSTVGSTGERLMPQQWHEREVSDINKISEADIKNYPFLERYRFGSTSRLVPGSDIVATFERGVLKLRKLKGNELILSKPASAVAVAPDGSAVHYSAPDGRTICSLDTRNVNGIETRNRCYTSQIPGTITEMRVDLNSNFLLAVVKDGADSSLVIIERDTGNIAGEVKDACGPIDLDQSGNVYFADGSGRLRVAHTNMSKLAPGTLEQLRNERRQAMIDLDSQLSVVELPAATGMKRRQRPEQLDEQQLLARMQEKISELVEDDLAAATTIEKIASLAERLDKLQRDPSFSAFPEVFEPVRDQLRVRSESLKLSSFERELKAFTDKLPEYDTAEKLPQLEMELARLTRTRRSIVIADSAARTRIEDSLSAIRDQVSRAFADVQKEVQAALQRKFVTVERMIVDTATPKELQLLQADEPVLELRRLIGIMRDEAVRLEWTEKVDTAFAQQRRKLVDAVQADEERERIQIMAGLEQSAKVISDVRDYLMQVTTVEELAVVKQTSPLMRAHMQAVAGLQKEFKLAEHQKLQELFDARRKAIENRVVAISTPLGTTAKFGDEEFPIFHHQPLVWAPKIRPLISDPTKGELLFESPSGDKYIPPCEAIPVDLSHVTTRAAIQRFSEEAKAYFDLRKPVPPAFNAKWVVNNYYLELLSDFSRLVRKQLEHQRGILILEGEAGTGKNVLVDMFGHNTNRVVHTFSCNFQTEKEDMTYAFRFDPEKGTHYVDSELIRKLQTPGTVVVLDEINALPTGVAKMLNPLLDYRRCLHLPDGRVIKVDPSVIIVGAMNPQNYLGVKQLSQEVKSRARFMRVGYPPEKDEKGKFYPYEAELLAQYVPELKGLKQEEFYALWHLTANGLKSPAADKVATKERVAAAKSLQEIVSTANRIRAAYRDFKSGKSSDPINFVFSLRETIDIAADLEPRADVKKLIEEVVLTKIGDPEEEDRVKLLIGQT